MTISSQKITTIGLLIALSVILTRLASIRIAIAGVEGIRIGLGRLPIILGGVLFGPIVGGIVGGLADLLGYFINPMGAYMPHFTLTSALGGIIPGVIINLKKEEFNYLNLTLAITIGQILTSLLLTPYFLHLLFGLPWLVILPPRLIAEPIQILIYTYTINLILKRDVLKIKSSSI